MTESRIRTALTLMINFSDSVFVTGERNKSISFDELKVIKEDLMYELDVRTLAGQTVTESGDRRSIVCLTRRRISLLPLLFRVKKLREVGGYLIAPSFENPRWILPLGRNSSWGMVNPTSLKAKIAFSIYKALSSVGLGFIVFPHRIRVYNASGNKPSSYLGDICERLPFCYGYNMLYLGSFGPLQKITVEFVGNDGVQYYGKFSNNKLTESALVAESSALHFVNALPLKFTRTPDVKGLHRINEEDITYLIQTPLHASDKCKAYSSILSSALTELFAYTKTRETKLIDQYIHALGDRLLAFKAEQLDATQSSSLDVAVGLFEKLQILMEGELILSFSHGDFTRWNILFDNDKACIFDWEEAGFRPVGFDLFHFFVIECALVNKGNAKVVYAEIHDLCNSDADLFGGYLYGNSGLVDRYLLFYITDLVSVYLWHAVAHIKGRYPVKDNINFMLVFLCSLAKLVKV